MSAPAFADCSLNNDTKIKVLERYKMLEPKLDVVELPHKETMKVIEALVAFGLPYPPFLADADTATLFDTGKETDKIEFAVYDKSGNLCGSARLMPNQWKKVILNYEKSNL
jgi:hypothetical protein